jgi:DNA repair protein RecN (Recombination protein N)
MLRNVERAVHHITAIDSTAQQLGERATELVVLAEDLARDLRTYGESIEAGPERLQAVEDRLSQIQGLKRKYGPTIEDVIAFGQYAQEQLDELTGASFDVEALQEQEQTLTRELAEASLALSEARQHAATELSARIEMSIAELRMGSSQVEIRVTHRDDPKGIPVDIGGTVQTVHFDETGIDVIEFLIAPNAGESLKPLGRIASGGETARLMLAVKSILSDIDTTPTLVFDEIDVGVGGRSAQVVGNKLRRLADDHQVIVVTHLPQIAAQAERHFAITKSDKDSRTISEVRELDERQRIEELAAMIDGLPLTDHAIASATDMLERSQTKV